MDFSATTPRGGGNRQAKFYLSLHATKLLAEFSARTGIAMSRIVDNLIRLEMSQQLPVDVVERITSELPKARPKKRTQRVTREKDFNLD